MKIPIFTLLLCSAALAYAQISFQQTYGGPSANLGYGLVESPTGEYYLVGLNNEIGSLADGQIHIIKADQDGNEIWSRFIGDSLKNQGNDVVLASNGDIVLCGNFGDYYNSNVALIRMDAAGNEIWRQTFSADSLISFGNTLTTTLDGGFLIAAELGDINDEDIWLIKTDATGNLEWEKRYGGASRDVPTEIYGLPDGGFLLSATTESEGAGQFDFYLIRLDVNGDTLWTQTYGTALSEICQGGFPTSDGGYVMAGLQIDSVSFSSDFLIVKTDAAGLQEWVTQYNADLGSYEFGNAITETPDGGFLVGGSIEGTGDGTQAYLLKLDNSGNVTWNKLLVRGVYSELNKLIRTNDGNFAFVGSTRDSTDDANHLQTYLVKLLADSLASSVDIIELAFEAKAFPNPATEFLNIEIPEVQQFSLEVFDLAGKLVLSSPNRHTQKLQVDIAALPQGTYIYQLSDEGQIFAKGKFIRH